MLVRRAGGRPGSLHKSDANSLVNIYVIATTEMFICNQYAQITIYIYYEDVNKIMCENNAAQKLFAMKNN